MSVYIYIRNEHDVLIVTLLLLHIVGIGQWIECDSVLVLLR